LIDALSFVFSIGSLLSIRYRRGLDAVRDTRLGQEYSARDLLEGLRWVRGDRFARRACLLNSGTTLLAQALIFIFLAEANRRMFSYLAVGIVLASAGAGGIVGSLAAKFLERWHHGLWLQIQMWIWLIVFSGILFTFTMRHSLRYLFVEIFVLGLSGAIGNLEIDKYLLLRSPDKLLARVVSVNNLMEYCAAAVGPILGGLFVELLGFQGAIYGLMFITDP
jgi:predicted MFS family arabinose efflux permease